MYYILYKLKPKKVLSEIWLQKKPEKDLAKIAVIIFCYSPHVQTNCSVCSAYFHLSI